jgi:adenosylcobinamide-GDP ribazoletransferase
MQPGDYKATQAEGKRMVTTDPRFYRLAADVRIAILFCTRVPLVHSSSICGSDVARASWAFPIAGALVGAIGALVYGAACRVGLPALPAAALALAATTASTGCLHEDGLADTADGFGGGKDRERKLAIMRDSRLGAYGACALAISFLLRWSALATIADPIAVASALPAAHAAARATLPAFMRFVPPARSDGLSAEAGRPMLSSAAGAALLGVLALLIGVGPVGALIGVVLLASAGILMSLLSMRQIGGQTGDVVGALEQTNEILCLLTAAVLLNPST